MPAPRKGPGVDALRRYIAQGLTQQQIADEWAKETGVHVSRTAIAMAMAKYKLESPRPRARHDELIPWRVKVEHNGHRDVIMLRLEARRRDGESLTRKEQVRLANWKEALAIKGAVIHYDPETPEGFHWVYPEAGDDDIIHYPSS